MHREANGFLDVERNPRVFHDSFAEITRTPPSPGLDLAAYNLTRMPKLCARQAAA